MRIAPVRLPEFCKACFGVHAAEFLLRIDAERSQRKEDLRAALGARLAVGQEGAVRLHLVLQPGKRPLHGLVPAVGRKGLQGHGRQVCLRGAGNEAEAAVRLLRRADGLHDPGARVFRPLRLRIGPGIDRQQGKDQAVEALRAELARKIPHAVVQQVHGRAVRPRTEGGRVASEHGDGQDRAGILRRHERIERALLGIALRDVPLKRSKISVIALVRTAGQQRHGEPISDGAARQLRCAALQKALTHAEQCPAALECLCRRRSCAAARQQCSAQQQDQNISHLLQGTYSSRFRSPSGPWGPLAAPWAP